MISQPVILHNDDQLVSKVVDDNGGKRFKTGINTLFPAACQEWFLFQRNSVASRCLPEFVETRVPRTHVGNQSAGLPVCRESCRSPVDANSTRPIGRSAGSNQGDEGGNEFVEVLCVTVTSGDLANMQAETRVNVE